MLVSDLYEQLTTLHQEMEADLRHQQRLAQQKGILGIRTYTLRCGLVYLLAAAEDLAGQLAEIPELPTREVTREN